MSLGFCLRSLRTLGELRQTDVATILGANQSKISLSERALVRPFLEDVIALAEHLGYEVTLRIQPKN